MKEKKTKKLKKMVLGEIILPCNNITTLMLSHRKGTWEENLKNKEKRF
jgi:hypothetical protein